MTSVDIINGVVNGTIVLNKETIKELFIGKEEMAEIKAEVKRIKTENRLKAFRSENCVMTYKGKEIAFNPRGVEGKRIVVWTNIDKNAIVYAMPNLDGNV